MPDQSETKLISSATFSDVQPEILLGTLVGYDKAGAPIVDWPENPSGRPLQAVSTTAYSRSDVGRTVAILFIGGDPNRPLIVGTIRQPLDDVMDVMEEIAGKDSRTESVLGPETGAEPKSTETVAQLDGERVVLSAKNEIVLQCGKSSITLTRAGKITIRGEHVVSRSSGANRIKGGSIQLN